MTTGLQLGEGYEVQREIGAGGMAHVFLGYDHKHERPVAIKVLRPELASGLGKARFVQEIKFAARLSHPHILPVFDSGETDGHLYFVMPLVEGPTVRARLTREGRLPLAAAIDLVRNVAAALDYAHRHEIVHRDIKPENIMIHDGVAVVTDFGVGKALSSAADSNLTRAGVAIGTPAYMSPEQLAGDPNIDARADIYSLGCVLFEILTGEQPFGGLSPAASLAARLSGTGPDVTKFDGSVPPHLSQAIRRAVAPQRGDRFETAGAFAAALVAVAEPVRARTDHSRLDSGPSIAVLPFANMSADPENDYFSDGVTEEIINALARLEHLHVSARTSSFAFKGKQIDIADVGSKLNVRTVLEGSVRRAGSRVRITAQLINVDDGYHLWSDRYDREMVDVFEVQDEIASAIADRLRVVLTDTDAGPKVQRGTEDLEAYHLYLRGRFLWNRRTKEGLRLAAECFERAIERDPEYAPAHAGLADVYLLLGSYLFMPRDEAQTKAKTAASRALALDETLAEAHTSLGQVLRWELDWEGEEQHYRRAIALNPGYATAHHWYAGLLQILGRTDEALASIARAAELDPLSHAIVATRGQLLNVNGHVDEARQQLERALELEPTFVTALAYLAYVYAQLDRRDEALRLQQRLVEIRPDHPFRIPHEAMVRLGLGQRDEARRLIDQVEADADPGFLGSLYAELGEIDRAFELLHRAVDEHKLTVVFWLKTDPSFDAIRGDERYTKLLRRLNLS